METTTQETPLLEVTNLSKLFPMKNGLWGNNKKHVHAVNNVSFQILGLVGESGCGKTTLGRTLLRLIEPTSGKIEFEGEDITQYNNAMMRTTWRKMQIIFQDPYAALNPRMTIVNALAEPLKIHDLHTNPTQRKRRIAELLDYVQLPKNILHKYPHEFSGGQRQRICIARALAVEPSFIVCDEAVAALDVSVQTQVINLLMELQEALGFTYLFISHDLKVVEFIANEVAVMYLGRIVEKGTVEKLYQTPKHPYTQSLLSAIPTTTLNHKKERIILEGDIPSPMELPTGCHFHPRCWKKTAICTTTYPQKDEAGKGHFFYCHHPIQ